MFRESIYFSPKRVSLGTLLLYFIGGRGGRENIQYFVRHFLRYLNLSLNTLGTPGPTIEALNTRISASHSET